jgi:hypothetical protein
VFFIGCSYENENDMESNTNMQNIERSNTEIKGDIFSASRWKHIESNSGKILIGMSKKQVISILGQSDSFDFIPEDVMQYSVAFGVIGQFQPKVLYIFLDKDKKVIKVQRSNLLYAPQTENGK